VWLLPVRYSDRLGSTIIQEEYDILELELDASADPSHPTDDNGEESYSLYIYPLLSLRWRSNFRLKPANEHPYYIMNITTTDA